MFGFKRIYKSVQKNFPACSRLLHNILFWVMILKRRVGGGDVFNSVFTCFSAVGVLCEKNFRSTTETLISMLWGTAELNVQGAYYLGPILGSFSKCLTVKRLEPEPPGPKKPYFPILSENSTLEVKLL